MFHMLGATPTNNKHNISEIKAVGDTKNSLSLIESLPYFINVFGDSGRGEFSLLFFNIIYVIFVINDNFTPWLVNFYGLF